MVLWDDLGFATNYSVEVGIEYPGDGEWRERRFGRGSTIARLTPRGGESWLLNTTLSDVDAVYGTPEPNWVCLFSRFNNVTLFDTRSPDSTRDLQVWPPVSIAASVDDALLFVGTYTDVAAIGAAGGVVWRARDIFTDDLHIRRTDNGRIVCRGWNYWDKTPTEVTLDAATGNVIT